MTGAIARPWLARCAAARPCDWSAASATVEGARLLAGAHRHPADVRSTGGGPPTQCLAVHSTGAGCDRRAGHDGSHIDEHGERLWVEVAR